MHSRTPKRSIRFIAASESSNSQRGIAMASTFQLKDSKGNTFSAVMVAGPCYRLADGRALDYVDAEDTFRIAETAEVLMRPYP
jgi:hypothetical protein